ncbi:uncharacterized protein [Ambystoma mexicanum]|uniref:uncharacterized protein isoform X2 n=1 Tax=Ambystoma mexicanum TaxID=8296 RepID=UPI0037E734FF
MSEDTIKILQRPLSERQVSQSLGPIIAPRGKYPNSKLRRSKSHEEPCGHGAQGQAFSGPREGRNTPPRMESPVPPKKDAKGSGGGASEEVARDILDAIVTAAIEQVKGRESMLEDAICQSVLIEPAEAKEDETILHQSVKRCIKLLQNNDALEKEVKLLQIEMDITNSKKNLEKTKQDIGLKCNTIHKIEEQILSNRRHLKEMKERSLHKAHSWIL